MKFSTKSATNRRLAPKKKRQRGGAPFSVEKPRFVRAVTPEMKLTATRHSLLDTAEPVKEDILCSLPMDKKYGAKSRPSKRAKTEGTAVSSFGVPKEGRKPYQPDDAEPILAHFPSKRNKLFYRLLLEDYDVQVQEGKCLAVDFGDSIKSAKASIKEALARLAKSLPNEKHPEVVAELKELRKCARQMQQFEDQEKLSIEKDSAEWFERQAHSNIKSQKEKRMLQDINKKRRKFCHEPVRFTKSSRNSRQFCECLWFSACAICQLAEYIPNNLESQTPKFRRVELFDLQDENGEEEEEEEEEEEGPIVFSPVENSVIALKSLLHSLEFIEEERKKE